MSRWVQDDAALSRRRAPRLSRAERAVVRRFGLLRPPVTDDVLGMRFGIALVTGALAFGLLVIALVVFL